jgi:hypothetical protein
VGVLQQSVYGGCGEGLGHEFVEPGRVDIEADRHGPFS